MRDSHDPRDDEPRLPADGPGGSVCLFTYGAWKRGFITEEMEEHVESCWYCRWMILGESDTIESMARVWREKIEEERDRREEMDRMNQSSQRQSRRRFFAKAAALVVVLGGAAAGGAFFAKRGGTNPTDVLEAQKELDLDKILVKQGAAAIQSMAQTGSPETRRRVARWIAHRGHTSLYQTLVALTSDADLEVRSSAVAACFGVPAIDLKSYLATLRANVNTESDRGLRRAFKRLIVRVEAA